MNENDFAELAYIIGKDLSLFINNLDLIKIKNKEIKLSEIKIDEQNFDIVVCIGFMYGDIDDISYLIDYGIPNKKYFGYDLCTFSCLTNNLEVIIYVFDNFECHTDNKFNYNHFLITCCYNDIESIEYVQKRFNYDLFVENNHLHNALCIASASNNLQVITYLIDKGLSPTHTDMYGNNCYLLACLNNTVDIIQFFLNKFDINVKNKYGENGFMLACWCNNVSCVKYLYEQGIDIFCKNIYGENAFIIACKNNKLDTIAYLKKHHYRLYVEAKFWLIDKINERNNTVHPYITYFDIPYILNKQCPICYDVCIQVFMTPCGHGYCMGCAIKWCEKCSICATQIKMICVPVI